LQSVYGGKGIAAFASKAMCALVNEEGLSLDAVSLGELYTALQLGFPADRVLLHGNNRPLAELQYAVQNGVGHIIADNITELEQIHKLAAAYGKRQKVQLRIKPGVEAHTHDFIRTGQIDSKFGFALQTGEAMEAIRIASAMSHIDLMFKVTDVLRLRIMACVAKPATAKCAGMRRGRRSRPSRMEAEPPEQGGEQLPFVKRCGGVHHLMFSIKICPQHLHQQFIMYKCRPFFYIFYILSSSRS